MSIVSPEGRTGKEPRGPLQATVRTALNDTALQLSVLQRRVGAHLQLKEPDLECFNIVYSDGPLSPSALARRAGVHPATMTGVLDRLERNGWIVRERDPDDRRAVRIRALKERNRELFGLLSGMNTAMGDILDRYSADELRLLADFLTRTVEAGAVAADELRPDA